MSQGVEERDSESLTPVIPEQDYDVVPSPPRRLVRQGGKEPLGSSRARAVVKTVLQDYVPEDEGALDLDDEPDLDSYFNGFGTDLHRRIALCRAYASYLAATVGIQRRRTRVAKKIRYGDDEQ